MKHFNERVETLKKDYQQFLEEGNIIGIRSIEKEIDKIINKWTYKNTKISNNKERDRQELLREKAITFLNEIRANIIKMEMDMEENNDYNAQININDTIITMHEKYENDIRQLLELCSDYLDRNDLVNSEKIINQLIINFDKWNKLIEMNPSIKPFRFDEVKQLFEELHNVYNNKISTKEESVMADSNDQQQNNVSASTNNNNNNVPANTNNQKPSFLASNWKPLTGGFVIGTAVGAAAMYFFLNSDD